MNVRMNRNEAAWVLSALRAYITSDAFGNDPDDVAAMGVLLVKVASAARVPIGSPVPEPDQRPKLTCHKCRAQYLYDHDGPCVHCGASSEYIYL